MKIEVLTTLKGNIGEMFHKGDIFESPNIPDTLIMELGEGRGLVREIESAPVDVPAPVSIPVEAPPPVEEPPVKAVRSHKRISR
jgi:hypothetical protein